MVMIYKMNKARQNRPKYFVTFTT